MSKQYLNSLLFMLALVLVSCNTGFKLTPTPIEEFLVNPTATLTPTLAPPDEPALLISEVLTGVDGDNNFEFIELYNTGAEAPFDLKGWSLWYKLSDNDPEKLVYSWAEHTLVPPQGHYLLVRDGQDVGIAPDMTFDVSMIPQRGSLQLRLLGGDVVDSITWGEGSAAFVEGKPANALKNGLALERLPGGTKGNWMDTGDNLVDFSFSSPSPQNTGSPLTPEREAGLTLSVDAPESVAPGDEFEYAISVTNETGQIVNNVVVQFPISLDLDIIQTPAEIEVSDQAEFWGLDHIWQSHQVALWNIGALDGGERASATLSLRAPWTYTQILVANYSVQAEDWPSPTFGGPVRVLVEGGAVPIGVIQDLVGEDLVVEGTATMYTGGFYAGTGNVKFYLEDETGGVQVWVPDGEGDVDVRIGSRVRVSGNLTVYRGALELIVNNLENVEEIEIPGANEAWTPTLTSIGNASKDPALAGRLVQVDGIVTRNEEFSYSYELDLMDEAGQLVSLYVDKLTNINVETIELGHYFRATGILEILDTIQLLYPRVQADLERIYPPELTLEMDAPTTVLTGDEIKVTLTAVNYTMDLLTNLVITAVMPRRGGVSFISASDGGEINGSNIIWTIPELAGNGTSVSVSYDLEVTASDGFLTFKDYRATADEWLEPAGGDPYLVFLGETVPIWAIQGPGDRSPYIFSMLTTGGTVTGVFPELQGFWVQETKTDNDPSTSAGLFIHTGELEIPVVAGNTVQLTGIVRETYQQTQVQITNPDDIVTLETGGPLPTTVMLDPPPDETESNAYYERLEGMLVQVNQIGSAVSPTSKYGEYVMVLAYRDVERIWQGDAAQNGLAIMVDDGSSAVHEDRSRLPYVINTGDRISGLIGPLAYTFGRYKIEPIVQPQVEPVETPAPSLELTSDDAFSIMTWNVENLFDVLDPHPSSPEKPGIREYKVSIAKVANTILAAGAPTIVGLQEVENVDILEDIAEHEALSEFNYQFFLIEGTDSRYIDNGYLVRGDVANVVDEVQHIAPEGLTSRPPLQIEVDIQTPTGSVSVHVLNNHFTSMSGGEAATEPRRNAQADWNVTVLQGILGENPGALVAIIGDLNSYYDSLPIDTLRDAGLVHVFEIDPEGGWYSYIYQGGSQTLDHILVTSNLFDLIHQVDILHVNADYAPPEAGDESPLRKSDHDPVIATFLLP
jgi:DNA/RNA endonuclease YhcR with UshA esterase domain